MINCSEIGVIVATRDRMIAGRILLWSVLADIDEKVGGARKRPLVLETSSKICALSEFYF